MNVGDVNFIASVLPLFRHVSQTIVERYKIEQASEPISVARRRTIGKAHRSGKTAQTFWKWPTLTIPGMARYATLVPLPIPEVDFALIHAKGAAEY